METRDVGRDRGPNILKLSRMDLHVQKMRQRIARFPVLLLTVFTNGVSGQPVLLLVMKVKGLEPEQKTKQSALLITETIAQTT